MPGPAPGPRPPGPGARAPGPGARAPSPEPGPRGQGRGPGPGPGAQALMCDNRQSIVGLRYLHVFSGSVDEPLGGQIVFMQNASNFTWEKEKGFVSALACNMFCNVWQC